MLRKGAEIISYAFHPLLMSTLVIVMLYVFAPSALRPIDPESIIAILSMVFVITFLVPLLSIGMLRLTTSITSLTLENRQERVMPFFFVAAYYTLAVYLFSYKLVLSETLVVLFSAITLTIFLVAVITTFFKISAHAAGAWGVIGLLLAIQIKFPDSRLLWPVVFMLLISGLINSSRLFLNRHSPLEVSTGSILGFSICFGIMYLFS